MRTVIVFALAIVAVKLPAQDSISEQLPEKLIPNIGLVIDAALEKSSTMYDRELAETMAEGRRIVGRSASKPTFGINFSYNQEEDQNSVTDAGFEERMVYSISLRKTLYHWGALKATKQISELYYDIETLNTETAIEGVFSGVRERYMALVIAKLAHQINEEALALKLTEQANEKQKSDDGLVSAASLYAVEVAVNGLEIANLRSKFDLDAKLLELSYYTGLDEETLSGLVGNEIPTFEPLTPESIHALEERFESNLQNDESIAAKNRSIEIDKKELKIAKVALRPKLSLQLGLSQNARDLNGVRREQEYVYAGISANWNIFDGFRTKGNKMEKLAQLQQNEASKKRLEEQLEMAFKRLLHVLELASRTLTIRETELRNSIGGLEHTEKEFEAGRVSEAVLTRLRQNYSQSSLNAQRARAEYLNALSKVSAFIEE